MNLIFAAQPDADKIGLLYDQGQDSSTTPIAAAKAYLDSKGIAYVERTGTTVDEVMLAADALVADGVEYPVDGIFILRSGVAPDLLMFGLEMQNGAIVTDRSMQTNLPGIFAAGDCTGTPYQLPKAVGEGNIAALSAVKYLDSAEKE
jgi:thioredoxin reductase (NADPH)